MKWLFGFVLVVTLAVTLAAQTGNIIGPSDAIGFDYRDADLTGAQVTRFEASYDSGTWGTLGMPPVAIAVNGVSTYRVIPPQTNGTHTVAFRACNAVGCSTSSGPFAFEVLGAPGIAPGNVRRIPR